MPVILKQVNWIDIIFIVVLLGMAYKGIRAGVGNQLISLVGNLLLVYVSIEYYGLLSEAVFGFLFQRWTKSAAFFVIGISVFIGSKAIERLFANSGSEDLASIERIGGGILSTFRAFLLCGIIGIQLVLIPMESVYTAVVKQSKSSMFFIDMDVALQTWMRSFIYNKGDNRKEKNEVKEQILTSVERNSD